MIGRYTEVISDKVKFKRFKQVGNTLIPRDRYFVSEQVKTMISMSPIELQILATGAIDGEQCEVEGSLQLNGVPGDFEFSYGNIALLSMLPRIGSDLFDKINFDHTINRLYFGTDIQNIKIQKAYPSKSFDFDISHNISPVNSSNPLQSHNYYARLVHHEFYDAENRIMSKAYMYTLNSHSIVKE
jgi:Endoplasmic reticulum vesicle transporter